jgi:hypothetical protein
MSKVYLDQKENTPCGGRVRYDVNVDDMISYANFTDIAKSSKCKKCSWNLICYKPE